MTTLEYFLTKQPAMGGALIIGENSIVKSAIGSAVYEENMPVDMNSRFHIGSTNSVHLKTKLSEMYINTKIKRPNHYGLRLGGHTGGR